MHTHVPGTVPSADTPWRTIAELRHDPTLLRDRMDATRALLATAGGRDPQEIEPPVAASAAHLGLIARLTAPLLALTALHDTVPSADPESVWWRPQPGATFPLSVPADHARAVTTSPAPPATTRPDPPRLAAVLLDDLAQFLADTLRPYGLHPPLAWGNTASAIHSASTALTTARPHEADRLRTLTVHLLAHPSLRDTHNDRSGPAFRRRTCCLIHRAAPAATGRPSAALLCADCPLAGR
ncbi:(2Fe-2S)-binding protein [Streptomyces smaragdinus]|uniref:(2Fe-2S)-binding protein n=1 Tax=Streptomyces smaragdinus TaxID=2585196 RepID=UPI00129776AE|nr:(2Fe-2S)-binding protein [Streptomyces smaragdinus]